MARRGASLLLFFLIVAVVATQCQCQASGNEKKVTNLHFFFHDIVSGDNPTVALVASPRNLSSDVAKQVMFGNVWAIDDPLTEGPEPDSKLVGRAQGFYMSVGQQTLTLVMGVDYGFVDGPYNGSSFSVFSRNPVTSTEREMAVVGGRGVFRMAQGVARLRTVSLKDTGDAVVEYNVTLLDD